VPRTPLNIIMIIVAAKNKLHDMKGLVAFVSGAGQGLGRATALRFAKQGARVVVADLSATNVERVVAEIGPESALGSVLDVTSEIAVRASLDEALRKWGKVNAVVNCAGILSPMKTLSKKGPANLEQFAKVQMVNVVGTFNVVRLAAERMAANSPDEDGLRGVIINTASIAAMEGQIGQAAYAASKGAIASMTLPIARDLSSYGIRVCCIAPGLFLTPMLEELSEDIRKGLAAGVPFPKRLGKPDEYARLAQSIIENPMLNGETIRLDGALRMQP
jgi:3-hydroxyacyl-CoA dehydrogenase / 3-hydroxy-2-methylbutyryl-CoA dehydrogenase